MHDVETPTEADAKRLRIAARITHYRRQRDMSKQRLADLCDVDRAYVWRWELGTGRYAVTPNPQHLQRLADALELPGPWVLEQPLDDDEPATAVRA